MYNFNLQKMFQCGCTSDDDSFSAVRHNPSCHGEAQQQSQPQHQPQHDDSSSPLADIKIQMESAMDYMERISKNRTKENWTVPKYNSNNNNIITAHACSNNENSHPNSSVATVFQIATISSSEINNTTRSCSLPSLQKSCTQSTADISDDDLSLSSRSSSSYNGEDKARTPVSTIVSVLRRKVKHGAIQPSTKSTVAFSPNTVFPDPNEKPQKRNMVKRLRKPTSISTYGNYDSNSSCYSDELRRLERRAKQRQYGYEEPFQSFYVFR